MAAFHFIVPVMSQVMAEAHWFYKDNPDGKCVEHLLTCCLSSLHNQVCRDFKIHVICHELPPLNAGLLGNRVEIHRVDFPRPTDIDLATYNRLAGKVLDNLPGEQRRRIGDKYSKLKVGLGAALGDPEARFSMFVDNDDLIHRDVVSYAMEHDVGESHGGHTVTSGYGWQVGAKVFSEMSGFHKTCGSCNVIRLTESEKELWAKTHDVNAFGRPDRKKHWLFAGHASVFQRIRNTGRVTTKFPFRAAVYTVATGHSFSGTNRAGRGEVPLTDELRGAFAL